MYTMNGARLIIRLLERQGVEIVAGIPGGANLPLYEALALQNYSPANAAAPPNR